MSKFRIIKHRMLFLKNRILILLLRILMILLVIFLLFQIRFSEKLDDDESLLNCSEETVFEDIIQNDSSYKYTIFFLESNYQRKKLTTKEMCAIESAAKANPKALVQVHRFSAKLCNNANLLRKIYPNIRLVDFKPEDVFKDTPILDWLQKGDIFTSPYAYSHLTDVFR